MSPLAVLGRGYAVARDEQGKILKSWRETAPGSRVSVTLGEGGFTAVVDKPYTKEDTAMSAKKQTFEQEIARLEEIVAALEKGDAPLADSLASV